MPNDPNRPGIALRALAVILVAPATFYFLFWTLPLIAILEAVWVRTVLALIAGIAAGGFVWHALGSRPQTLVRHTLLGALIVGCISFSAGFFGPLIVTPEANQGPLLGLCFTGPLGLALGAIGGFVYSVVRRAAKKSHIQVGS